MKKGYVTEATAAHCLYLAPRLRKEDEEECMAAAGAVPVLALLSSLGNSEKAWTMIGKCGNPVGMFGIAPGHDEMDRTVWMLASDAINDNRIQFLRESRWWINELNRIHPLLWNWVDSRNELHIKWLEWNGFTFINRSPRIAGGPDFIHFVRINPCASAQDQH